jgi:hypothetical protein
MSSSSDEGTVPAIKNKKQDKNSKKAAAASEKLSNDFQIKPAKGGPSMDTSTWPLLLKVRASHTYSIHFS